MKSTLAILKLSIFFIVLNLCTGCGPSNGVARIKRSGVLTVGVASDTTGLSRLNPVTETYEGFEIELARLFAKEIFNNPDKVKFDRVSPKNRGALLENEEVDMVIAAFTISDARKMLYHFSTPYYTNAVQLLVKKENGYTTLRDLSGKIIGVIQPSTTRDIISQAITSSGISVEFAEFNHFSDIKSALDSGRVDAFGMDKSVLKSFVDETTTLLREELSPQPYGVATKLNNKALAEFVDSAIQKWLADGTINNLIRQFNL